MSAATTPYAGIGITLGWKVGGSSSFTNTLMLMDDCEFDGFDTTVIPVPTLSSIVVTKVPGRTDNGSFTGTFYLVNADPGVTEFLALAAARTTAAFQVQLPDGSSGVGGTTGTAYVFSGFVSNVAPNNFTGDDSPHLDFTIAISGAVTINAAS